MLTGLRKVRVKITKRNFICKNPNTRIILYDVHFSDEEMMKIIVYLVLVFDIYIYGVDG